MSVTPVLAAVLRQQPQEPWCRDDVIACACAGSHTLSYSAGESWNIPRQLDTLHVFP